MPKIKTKTFDPDELLFDLFAMRVSEVQEMFWEELMSQTPHIGKIEVMLESGLVDVGAKDEVGWTPLHVASDSGSIETAKLLLDRGADVNAKDEWGKTPLHWASIENYIETAELLLDRGADVKAKDDDGWTPLHWASWDNRIEIAKLLLEKGADPWAEDSSNKIPYDYAKEKLKPLLKEYMKKPFAKKKNIV